jgi:hypothetical protein
VRLREPLKKDWAKTKRRANAARLALASAGYLAAIGRNWDALKLLCTAVLLESEWHSRYDIGCSLVTATIFLEWLCVLGLPPHLMLILGAMLSTVMSGTFGGEEPCTAISSESDDDASDESDGVVECPRKRLRRHSGNARLRRRREGTHYRCGSSNDSGAMSHDKEDSADASDSEGGQGEIFGLSLRDAAGQPSGSASPSASSVEAGESAGDGEVWGLSMRDNVGGANDIDEPHSFADESFEDDDPDLQPSTSTRQKRKYKEKRGGAHHKSMSIRISEANNPGVVEAMLSKLCHQIFPTCDLDGTQQYDTDGDLKYTTYASPCRPRVEPCMCGSPLS